MKENEAPTKLYVNTNDHLTRNGFYAFTENNRKDSVEYTRTDAFIEKAWDWIEDNILSSSQQDKSRLYFEQFRKYMKGE